MSDTNIDVHLRIGNATQADCGYVFDKRLRGLDWASELDNGCYPVTCIDCRVFHAPKRKVGGSWLGKSRKVR